MFWVGFLLVDSFASSERTEGVGGDDLGRCGAPHVMILSQYDGTC